MNHDAATTAVLRVCRDSLRRNSKTFSLAALLFPAAIRDDAAIVYAFCRSVDDAVDTAADVGDARLRLDVVRQHLALLSQGAGTGDPVTDAFGDVLRRRGIPGGIADELVAGMAMDLAQQSYRTLDELLVYCYRAAGTVGWMMARVMGVSRRSDVVHAVHLGIAMQLTNICRDVLEDWNRRRLYLPKDLLQASGHSGLASRLGEGLPDSALPAIGMTVQELLRLADRYYASGDAGLPALPFRCELAVRSARLLYRAIGTELRRRRCDVRLGRVVVSPLRKAVLLGWALILSLVELPERLWRRSSRVADGARDDGGDLIRL
jgi:15-cis-phytoene synthase